GERRERLRVPQDPGVGFLTAEVPGVEVRGDDSPQTAGQEEDDRLRASAEAEGGGLGGEAPEPPEPVHALSELPFLPVEAGRGGGVPEIHERLPPGGVRPVPLVADFVERWVAKRCL